MIRIVKILRSKWIDLIPIVLLGAIAMLKGVGYVTAGIGVVFWCFVYLTRHLIKIGDDYK